MLAGTAGMRGPGIWEDGTMVSNIGSTGTWVIRSIERGDMGEGIGV